MTRATNRLEATVLLLVVTGAIGLMLVAGLPPTPPSRIFPEELRHAQAARAVAGGELPSPDLYGALLAPARASIGDAAFPWRSRFVNILLVLGTIVPAYRLGRNTLGRGLSVVAAGAAVLWPGLVMTRVLVAENALVPVTAWLAVALLSLARRPSVSRAIGVGALVGVGTLADPRFAVMLGPVCITIVAAVRPCGSNLLVSLATAAIVATPWWLAAGVPGSTWAALAPTWGRSVVEYGRGIGTECVIWLLALGGVIVTLAVTDVLGGLFARRPARRAIAWFTATAVGGLTVHGALRAAGAVDERTLLAGMPLLVVAALRGAGRAERRWFAALLASGVVGAIAILVPPTALAPGDGGSLFDYPTGPALTRWHDLVGSPWNVRISLLVSAAIPLLALVHRRALAAAAVLALAWPWAATGFAFRELQPMREHHERRVGSILRWLDEHTRPDDLIVHHGVRTDLPFQTALHFDTDHHAVDATFTPIPGTAVRFDADGGTFSAPGRTGRTLLLSNCVPDWYGGTLARWNRLSLVDVSDGLRSRKSWLGVSREPRLVPRTDDIDDARWCRPDTTIEWSVEYPAEHTLALVIEHPADSPIDTPVTLRIRLPHRTVITHTLGRGETYRLDTALPLWHPTPRLHVVCDRSFERDGKPRSLRITRVELTRR